MDALSATVSTIMQSMSSMDINSKHGGSSTSSQQKPKAALLQLPQEVKDQIWRLVAVSPVSIKIRPHLRRINQYDVLPYRDSELYGVKYQANDEPWRSANLASAFTCRQLYSDIIPMYYAGNTFRLERYSTFGPGPVDFLKADPEQEDGPIEGAGITTFLSLWRNDHDPEYIELETEIMQRWQLSRGDVLQLFLGSAQIKIVGRGPGMERRAWIALRALDKAEIWEDGEGTRTVELAELKEIIQEWFRFKGP